ncbi:MAG: NAD-dependent epimerase/dehydratase family protein [Candidatus Paceibacterota bacterium]|jgi:UDP-glucose 4-epimerase
MKYKKVLVTGGAGFIGSHIVIVLQKAGYDVVVLDNLSTGKREKLPAGVKFYERDITKDIQDIFNIEKPDIVIHTAAQVMLRRSLEEPVFDALQNIIGTINVLEACKKSGVKRVIYTSTGGARVGEPEYLPVDEKHPIKPMSPYGISKHTAEHYVWMYHELYGLDYLIFCFGNVYGPGDDPKFRRVTAIFIEAMMKGESPTIFGDGEQTRDFIYVLDIAEFIVNAMEKNPAHKLFHLANGSQVSVNQVFTILKNLLKFKGEAKHIEAVKGEVRDIMLDTTLAQKELGWKPSHTMEQGLKEMLDKSILAL